MMHFKLKDNVLSKREAAEEAQCHFETGCEKYFEQMKAIAQAHFGGESGNQSHLTDNSESSNQSKD